MILYSLHEPQNNLWSVNQKIDSSMKFVAKTHSSKCNFLIFILFIVVTNMSHALIQVFKHG